MHLLWVVSYYKPADVYGGPIKSVSSMCEALAQQGVAVTVLTTNANGDQVLDVPMAQALDVTGVRVFYYPITSWGPRSFFYSPALAEACARMIPEFDLVVLETFFTHAMQPAVSACRGSEVPYIVPPRGQLLPWALRHKPLKKWLYLALVGWRDLNRAAALWCTAPVEQAAIAKLRLQSPTFVVPNGVDLARWAQLPPRGSLRHRLAVPETAMLMLVLGRLHRVKNPALAVDTLVALRRSNVHLVYVGPDEEHLQTQLLTRAAQHGCAGRVHFAGLLTGADIAQAFADADLLLMPSVMESFGVAAAEALAAGLPVVTSDTVPVGLWAQAAEAGRAVPSTAIALAQTIRDLLTQPKILRSMGERGQQLARERFDIRHSASQLARHFQSIIATGRPAVIASSS